MRTFTRFAIVSFIALAMLVVAAKFRRTSTAHNSTNPKEADLIVHEWGTFTSIAGKDGVALEWRPLNGSSDLPKFVHTIQQEGLGLRHALSKELLSAQVRMETPVLYFYANRELNVSARVDFPKGKITEWYPQARTLEQGINWGTLKVSPGAPFNLPADYSDNHYYAARETDAAPLQVCGTANKPAEQEKFLFYRGVGSFELPLTVRLDGNQLLLTNVQKEPIAKVLIFEKRADKIGFRAIDNVSGQVKTDRPAVDQTLEAVLRDLKVSLVSAGLYDKEADAMIKTWRDSWFEEGLRVFYILPRSTTDRVLPITIDPQPKEMVRVLVGRTEVITPELEKKVKAQVSLLNHASSQVRDQARREIQTYGRFYEPILKRILEDEKDATIRAPIEQALASSLSKGK